MAFLKTNYRKNQFVARVRLTNVLTSGVGFICVSLGNQGYPMPADANDVLWQAYPIIAGTFPVQIMSPGSLSGNYIALSIFYSGTSASLADSASITLIANWLIGSR